MTTRSTRHNPARPVRHYLGIDTGGTFTDFALLRDGNLETHKVPSTPDAPDRAIWQGIRDLGLIDATRQGHLTIIHGTTVATNAVLEAKGVRTAYITNEGLGDILLIGRQTRQHLYDLTPEPPKQPFGSHVSVEVASRLDARGQLLARLSEADLTALKQQLASLDVESVAINLVFSYLDPSEEERIESVLRDQYFVSRSSFVLPRAGEYERGVATWINAWIGPLIDAYMHSIAGAVQPSTIAIMQSSGLTISTAQAATRAVNLLLSGPAGGIAAAAMLSKQTGQNKMLTFDMGGTSTDVSLVSGPPVLIARGRIANLPVHVPMTDIHTIGAGGGSVAYVDAGGLLRVGPRSAGAVPGPACYGRGGTEATVTDAHAALGRLPAEAFFGGQMSLALGASRLAIEQLAHQLDIPPLDVAQGIIDIANDHMVAALKVISIERGFDPQAFTLTSFGGAGGLHVCELAETLGIRQVLVPMDAGVLSAVGMLATTPGREMIRTRECLLGEVTHSQLNTWFEELEAAATLELRTETDDPLVFRRGLDLRYDGQTHTLEVPYDNHETVSETFQALHEQRFGHRLNHPVELCHLRVNAHAQNAPLDTYRADTRSGRIRVKSNIQRGTDQQVSIYLNGEVFRVTLLLREDMGREDGCSGPALIVDRHTTVLVRPGWSVRCDEFGHLHMTR